ncbi:MAG: NAD-dependent epimerase/dehydratase family protein [Bacteriovoracaceae bacterium]
MPLPPTDFTGKTVLIAGAAGFIPGHMAEFYLNLGAKVIGIDNFITGTQKNIEILKRYPQFTFFNQNIFMGLPDFSRLSIDYIFNMASPASPIDFAKIPVEIMRINSEGTLHLLELAKRKNARILEASTSEVYGDPDIHPQVESYNGNVNPIGPRSCYDESKRFAEALTMTYNRLGVDTRIVRIFNTYGPRMRPDDGRVIPNFVNQALRNEDITVFGDGSQTRSYCYVSDLVDAIHYVMFTEDPTPFNIGNADEYTVLETAEKIIKLTDSKSKIIYKDLPKDDPRKRRPSLTKIQSQSPYSPKINFDEGLLRTIEHFKNL